MDSNLDQELLVGSGMSLAQLPELTVHARKRWDERCQGLDLQAEWASSLRHRCGMKTLRRIRECCPMHDEFATKSFRGYYYRMSIRGTVFVMAPPMTVITVFRIDLNSGTTSKPTTP